MTQSAEDSARAILRVFSSEDVRAGHALMYEAVKLQFLKSRSAEDFAAGLAFAIEREWLSNENIMIRLTKSGFDENSEAQIRAFTRGDDFF
jgi:hypothetical protein